MVKLRYIGPGVYRGVDPASGRLIIATEQDTLLVSPEKARQLLADFPGMWQVVEDEERPRRKHGRNKLRRPRRDKGTGRHP